MFCFLFLAPYARTTRYEEAFFPLENQGKKGSLRSRASLLSFQKTENKTGFPLIVLKPVSSAVGSDGSFLFTAYSSKNVLFAHSTSPLPRILASQDTGRNQT